MGDRYMSDTQKNRIVDENLKFLAEQDLKRWMKHVKYCVSSPDKCIKFGFYEEDRTFVNYETIWDLDQIHPEATVRATWTEYRYLQGNTEYRLYLDRFPKDIFGQIATYKNPPACYWLYIDRNSTVWPSFLSKLDSKRWDYLREYPYEDSGWDGSHPFSLVSEFVDSSTSDLFWTCFTYDPKLSENEVLDFMRQLYVPEWV
jgi:hypothetical protein